MKISDILREDKTTISFEVFPPKTTANFESVKKAALGVAALHPDYMSVTYGAGGSNRGNTLHIAEEIQKAENVTTIAHLTCVGAGKEDIRTALSEMKEAGIENILALRGDRPKDFDGDPFKEYHYASELVATIKEYGDFCVGGACYPEGHPDSTNKKEDIKNLKKKVDAGCEFLPQLLMSAEAAKAGFAAIKEYVESTGTRQEKKGTVVIATVKGDIHDIGKNIVKVLLENYGFDVIDLGKDVPPEAVVEAVQQSGARLVGLSALMTTTVTMMCRL
ncbi:MAG: methylenetetrahydrofolate reductase [Lachnospiraceae bacterium]|nr:methylenetetrahydrofolate reductase [Lachnospiraceae bacterium]